MTTIQRVAPEAADTRPSVDDTDPATASAAGPEDFPQAVLAAAEHAVMVAKRSTTVSLIAALAPLTSRVRTDVTAVKKADGTQAWTSDKLTAERLAKHLNGGPARGVCPIKAGESVTMVAVLDFDSHKGEATWAQMAEAAGKVVDALQRRGLAPTAFRSSGGRGIHLILVWDEAQDAYSVRVLLVEALAEAGYANGTAGVLASQVEVFPKQDSVPVDGFGNQFVLPLAGHSVPLDPIDFSPMPKLAELISWAPSQPVPQRVRPQREALAVVPTGDTERLRRALAAIPNEDGAELDYETWRNVVFAIGHAVGDGTDEHRALAHEFSARSSKYDPDFLDNRVLPYTRSREGGVSEGTIYRLASELGNFEGAASPEEFDNAVEDSVTDAGKAQRFKVLAPGEFASRLPPRWIVKGVLPDAELVVVFGESGSGKTFAVFDLAAAVARGVQWRGRKVRQGRVVYIAAEGAGGFRNRYVAYAQQAGIPVDAVGVEVIADAPNLLLKDDALDIVRAIGRADLVVVDTFAQVTPGGNENSGEDVGKALAHCKGIRRATGATVLLVHHAGKDLTKGARGWSGLRAAADAEIEVSRDHEARGLRLSKQKDGEDGLVFGFTLEPVVIGVDGDGDPITSCVVVEGTAPVAAVVRPLGKVQVIVNAVIQEMAEAQSAGIEIEAVVAEAARRMPEPEQGKRDKRRYYARRAVHELCEGANPLYQLEDECLSVI